jgi:hypothetical protein
MYVLLRASHHTKHLAADSAIACVPLFSLCFHSVFTLFSLCFHSLCRYTVGNLARVHPNGRINYAQGLTRADGADLQAVKAMAASKRLEKVAGNSMGGVNTKAEPSFPQFPDSDDG